VSEYERVRRLLAGSEPAELANCRKTFKKWLGDEYDTDALDVMLCAAAVEQTDGDPLWLLIISGAGNAKTETVQSLTGAGAHAVSTISSDAALLSGTPKHERSKNATGGLLRKIGGRGVLVVKDVTSILSANRDARATILAALREVYDGRWSRDVGTEGGLTLEWAGRITVVGAVTTAWDQAHAVVAAMGDRFVLLRMDSTSGRETAGRRAIRNTGSETTMRAELAAAVGDVLANVDLTTETRISDQELELLLSAANIVTLARTAVEYDYRGDVIDAHAPEMPTRFAKQLTQIVRGGVAVGMDRRHALRLAIRCARDSMPPLRLAILLDVNANPYSKTRDIRQRLNKPRATVDRQLQALHMLGLLECAEEETVWAGKEATIWRYLVADHIKLDALDPAKSVPDLLVATPNPKEEGSSSGLGSNISGTDPPAPHTARCPWPTGPLGSGLGCTCLDEQESA